ncbi:MAG: ferredoxin reductase family protein [Acidimicrobiales bacterium]
MTAGALPVATREPSSESTVRSPTSPAPRPLAVTFAVIVLGFGFGATVATAITTETAGQLRAAGGLAIFLGSISGLAGTYLALVMVLIVSRVPYVERVLGQDGLLRWHRRIAPWPISLIVAHVVLLTIGYAEAAHAGAWHEIGTLLSSVPDVLIATIGFFILVAVAIVSIYQIRSRMPRERWWAIHLFMYLALGLAFAHVIVLGPSFVNHPITRVLWGVLWFGTVGLVLIYRIGLPIFRSARHRLVVAEIRSEGPGVVSVICRGRKLERLAFSGGQFFEWRFLTRRMWWQAHPFSLSARPVPPYVRLTVKAVGDFTATVAKLRAGTRIAIEGPYGAFTSHARSQKKVACLAGGIGVTAIRALLEDLPIGTDPVVVLRASTEKDLVLLSEVEELVRQRHGQLHALAGSRDAIGLGRLLGLVPDLVGRDVFVSGPENFVKGTVAELAKFGVPETAIHSEVYSL